MASVIVLFAYAFASNVALAIVPHEPVIIWYGAQVGIWSTAGIATAGTLVASWVDHRLFVPLLLRASDSRPLAHGPVGAMRRWFGWRCGSRGGFAGGCLQLLQETLDVGEVVVGV